MALVLVFFLFGAFSLIPGGCTFFSLGAVSQMATLAPTGAVFLITATEEFTFAALQLWFFAFFHKVFFFTMEAFVVAAPGGIVMVPPSGTTFKRT